MDDKWRWGGREGAGAGGAEDGPRREGRREAGHEVHGEAGHEVHGEAGREVRCETWREAWRTG